MNTRFILIHPSHAGNVGAVARAMKVMGFDDLVLVSPRWADVLSRPEAIERASGAADVLGRARVVDHLGAALEGVDHVCATAMTPRDFGPPTHSPRNHFESLAALVAPEAQRPQSVAFLFGSERYGMRNEDVYRCHVCLQIPTAPDYGSLNLAAAVQLIAYEWRQCVGGLDVSLPPPQAHAADAAQVAGLIDHWQQALVDVGFLDPQTPRKLMPRLHQMFNRARLTQEEVHILRGIARAMSQASQGSATPPAADRAIGAASAPERPHR
jgi:tRNA/rRNA methyltransferase